jgi:2-oxoglutarate ferredoxin oxidoreductase subunit delta
MVVSKGKELKMAKGHIEVDEAKCKGCTLCTMVCPYDLLSMADHFNSRGYRPVLQTDPEERCTGCMLCAMICPDAVITVFRQVKVALPVADPQVMVV